MRALRRRHPADRARAADRQGRERLDPAARGAGALLPAAQRGLRAAAGRGRGAGRGARRRPEGGGGRAAAARLRRQTRPLRLALPGGRHGARRRALPAPPAHRAEPRRARPGGSTGRSRAPCWCAARRPPRSATSTPTSSSTTTSATSAKRLADAGWHTLFVPARRGRPPRPALDRPRRGPAADRRIPPQPRPLHAQAPRSRGGPRGPRAHRLVLRAARARGDRPPQPARRASTGPTPARRSSRTAARASDDRGTRPKGDVRLSQVFVPSQLGLVGLGDRAIDRGRPRGARRRGRLTSSPGWRRRASQRRSLGGEEAAGEEDERVERPEGDAAEQAGDAGGRQQQLARSRPGPPRPGRPGRGGPIRRGPGRGAG